MTDKITGRPRGFGFVTFRDQDAVEKVLLEAHSIDGRTVECKRAVPLDQQQQQSGYTAGASSGAAAGGSGANAPGGYGSAAGGTFQPPAASRPLGGSTGGATLSQRAVQSDATLPGEDSGYNPKKIFSGGLPASCDEAKLRAYFSKYGGIVDCVVMIDRVAQRHRGFGYVTFEDPKSVDQTMAEHDSHQIDGKWIDVKRCVIQDPAQRKQQGYPTQAAGPIRRRTDGAGYSAGYGGPAAGYGPAGYGPAAGGAAGGYDGSSGYYYNAPPTQGGYAAYGYGAAYGAPAHGAGPAGYGPAAGSYGAPGPAGYGAAGAGAVYGGYGAAGAAGGRTGLYTGPAGAAGSAVARPGAAGPAGATQTAGYARPGAGPAGAQGGYGAAYYGGNPYHYAQAAAGYGAAAPTGYGGYGGARPGSNDGGYGGAAKQPSSPGGRGGAAPY